MDLTGIISISGKPGLYSIVAQSPNNIIVENLESGRRSPAFSTNKISALSDITMYTKDDDMPLADILKNIWDKESGKKSLNHKDDIKKLRSYLNDIIPDCDHDRIYDSDIKKLFQWYNLLHTSGTIKKKIEEAEKSKKSEKAKDDKTKSDKTEEKKPTAKSKEKKSNIKTGSANKGKTASSAKSNTKSKASTPKTKKKA